MDSLILFTLYYQKKPDWALGEKEGKSKSVSEVPAEAAPEEVRCLILIKFK